MDMKVIIIIWYVFLNIFIFFYIFNFDDDLNIY